MIHLAWHFFVSLHPLGVIVAIGCGVLVAGIAGALIAVPLASAVNAVVQHLAAYTDPGDDPVGNLEQEHAAAGEDPQAAAEESTDSADDFANDLGRRPACLAADRRQPVYGSAARISTCSVLPVGAT